MISPQLLYGPSLPSPSAESLGTVKSVTLSKSPQQEIQDLRTLLQEQDGAIKLSRKIISLPDLVAATSELERKEHKKQIQE